jgi:hypothetical protein
LTGAGERRRVTLRELLERALPRAPADRGEAAAGQPLPLPVRARELRDGVGERVRPIVRPLCLTDPGDRRGWTLADAYGYGPALWVAPALDEGSEARRVYLPRGEWIDAWTGEGVRGGHEVIATTPLERIPVWVRQGSIVATYPADHIASGLGDVPERERPLEATLWGRPRLGRTATRLADGTLIRWERGRWSVAPTRPVVLRER